MNFLIPLAGLIAGILAGMILKEPFWGAIPLLGGLAFYFGILRRSITPYTSYRLNSRHAVWIFLIFSGIGMLDITLRRPMEIQENDFDKFALAEGEIKKVSTYADGDNFLVDVTHIVDTLGNVSSTQNMRILLSTDGVSATPGNIVTFPARLTLISDNRDYRPNGYAERLRREGILYRVYARSGEVRLKGFSLGVFSLASGWRDRLVSTIEYSSLQRSTAEFVSALLFGDRSLLDKEVREDFSNAGVAHILALSGMHVAIVMGIFLIILFPLEYLRLRRLRMWLAILLVWGFAFITGLGASTVRACIMATFVVGAMSLQRRNSSGNALLASAFVILLFDPRAIFDIGMQLSFVCVGGILLFADYLNPVNRHRHHFWHMVVSTVLVSLVATLSTWVLVAFYFHKVPLLFLPVNLCILPLLPLFVWLAAIYSVSIVAGYDPHWLAGIIDTMYDIFLWVAQNISALGEASVSYWAQLPVVIVWLLGVMIIGYAVKRRKGGKKMLLWGGAGMLGLALLMIPFLKEPEDGLIVRRNPNDITLALYEGSREKVTRMPRNTVSRLIHKGSEVISIDCRADIDSLAGILARTRRGKRSYLILGEGFKGRNLKDIPDVSRFDKIILHPSMKRKMEKKLKEEALELGIGSLHSIREIGSFSEFLEEDSVRAMR